MRLLGIILIILGAASLIYGGITYTKRRDTVKLGPFSAVVRQKERFAVPPIVGGLVLAAGVALVIVGSRRRS
jgi:hypothetical protein